MVKLSVGICTKKIHGGSNMEALIKSIPNDVTIYILSGTKETVGDKLYGRSFNFLNLPDDEHGYDLVRNRKCIYESFCSSDDELLLYLDDDEIFPDDVIEFNEFYYSNKDVGMLPHQNLFRGVPMRCTGKNFHARLVRKGNFPLEGKVIERVVSNKSRYLLSTTIKHDFLRDGMESFILRANRWAKESSGSVNNTGMRPNIQKLRSKLGILTPFVRFMYHYFWKLGFLDGKAGFFISMNYAVGEYLVQLYKYEREIK